MGSAEIPSFSVFTAPTVELVECTKAKLIEKCLEELNSVENREKLVRGEAAYVAVPQSLPFAKTVVDAVRVAFESAGWSCFSEKVGGDINVRLIFYKPKDKGLPSPLDIVKPVRETIVKQVAEKLLAIIELKKAELAVEETITFEYNADSFSVLDSALQLLHEAGWRVGISGSENNLVTVKAGMRVA
ncbi:MAG: hypothetical protein SGJ27_31125 [Candidatus Melainabacteria bacterium]|nr:hypothetical protein [Candidatus Melainabacteria bacterium]